MILIKYTKQNGAEFIPHLDTLRHFTKTVRRMGIPINYSQGFNPHVLIYLSSPIALGLKSESEYCLFDTPCEADGFIELFNASSPKGIRCLSAHKVEKKVNVASDITSALYEIKGINKFDVSEVLDNAEFKVFDNRAGAEKVVRDRIKKLYFDGDVLYAELLFGNVTLRPDYLVNKLVELYGENHPTVLKKEVFFLDGMTVDEYLAQHNVGAK